MNITPVVIAVLVCCAPFSGEAEAGPLAPGLWGGDHVRMVVSRSGAQLEFDCANGTIEQPINVDPRGRFAVKGSFTPEHGGPRRDDRAAAPRARFAGQLSGDAMKLTVTLERSKQPVGVFSLTRGNDPLLTKCR